MVVLCPAVPCENGGTCDTTNPLNLVCDCDGTGFGKDLCETIFFSSCIQYTQHYPKLQCKGFDDF